MSDPEVAHKPRRVVRLMWWHRPAVAMLRALIGMFGFLPAPISYFIADLLALPVAAYWAITDRGGKRKKGYWRNVRIAFRTGVLLPIRPPHHLWRFARHVTWLAVDFCRMSRLRADNLGRYVDLSEVTQLQQIYKEGHGIIWATAHIGVWDVAGYASGLLGMKITSVFRPSQIHALDILISSLRTGSGQTVVAKWNVLRTLKQVVERGESIGLLVDSAGNHGTVFPPFLGTRAATVSTPAVLHLTTGAPIVVIVALRTGRFRFRLRVMDVIRKTASPDRDADVALILGRINLGLSKAIAEAPEQWFWQSRRFKHRPAAELPGNDGLPPTAT